MGVDARLFVLATYSGMCDADGFVEHVFTLNRERDLWTLFEDVIKTADRRSWSKIQLPEGSWCWFSGEKRPKKYEDRECGWLTHDPYGNSIVSVKGSVLAALADRSEYDWNKAVLRFVGEHFAGRDVVVYWT